MKPLLLLVDLQEDFLAQSGLEPHRATVVGDALTLLRGCRERGVPVCHVQTTVHREPDDRMPHWKAAGRWACVAGSPGHRMAPELEPLPGETVLHKRVFSAFAHPELPALLETIGADTIIIAGVHTHTCIRQAALDAYQSGLNTWVAADAIGSYEPLDAAQTELYLRRRGVAFFGTHELFERLDGRAPADDANARVVRAREAVRIATRNVQLAQNDALSANTSARLEILERTAGLLEQQSEALAEQLTTGVGKPIRYARAEVQRAALLFRTVAERVSGQILECVEPEARVRRRAHGLLALVTPWNNPLAIPAGQLAPALAYGNRVVWKPALAGLPVALALGRLMLAAGLPAWWLQIVEGGYEEGIELISHRAVNAVSFTGSSANGWKVMHLCGSQHKWLQAELGGNNGAIVCADAEDLPGVARQVVEAAFAFAGQRCTATRRVIVLEAIYDSFLSLLQERTAEMVWGGPEDERTQIGPLLSPARAERVAALVERARAVGATVVQPHLDLAAGVAALRPEGDAYHPPTIILCDQPDSEIVQEETFGPVLVVQRARDWKQALELLNGVRHGLAAACFTGDAGMQERFLAAAKAGILKINRATADAGVDVPFGGWKNSGIGVPQHGQANVEFYTRFQSIYRG